MLVYQRVPPIFAVDPWTHRKATSRLRSSFRWTSFIRDLGRGREQWLGDLAMSEKPWQKRKVTLK